MSRVSSSTITRPRLPISTLLSRTQPRVLVVAHRGSWKTAPENSLAAIEAAIELGVDIVEVDIESTLDGVLLTLHDDTLERTTDGAGQLVCSTYAGVRQHRLREGAGAGATLLTEESMPLLTEVLEAARGRILLN